MGAPNKTTTETATQVNTTTQSVTTTAQPWLPAKWDYTTDVVVLGTGLSGLATSISAADAGANVLLLEKLDQAHEGGNSRVSGNMFWAPNDVTLGAQYITAMEKGSLTDQNIIVYMAQGLVDNLAKITSFGGAYAPINIGSAPEWPVYPGSSTVQTYGISLDGGKTSVLGGGHLWQLYRDQVTSRSSKITVMYSTPATGLIQDDDTKMILGVTATSNGSTINIKANKGVVLACGAFEFNPDMQRQYLPAWPIYGYGTPGNTGDGTLMAEAAGADLWHMNVANGGSPSVIVVPDFDYPVDFVEMPANGFIYVDKHGNRYMNEDGLNRHGWGQTEWTCQFNGAEGDFLRIPTYAILDATALKAGPLVPATLLGGVMGWFNWHSGYTWSSDNSTEVAKGWIMQGTSLADLASKIAADPDNQNPMGKPTIDPTGAGLQATVSRWNGFVAAKADSDFGRPSAAMAAIQTAPFYAVKLWPATVNNQGGPRRNIKCQIVDRSGNPIPHFYSAGECGSFWGWTYNAGGNLGEDQFSGRTAGQNAAQETPV